MITETEKQVLTNAYFLYAEMAEMLLEIVESVMTSNGMGLEKQFKRHHKMAMEGFAKMQYNLKKVCQESEKLGVDWDALRKDANDLMRINLLFIDHVGNDHQLQNNFELMIKALPRKGIFSASTIDRFTMK